MLKQKYFKRLILSVLALSFLTSFSFNTKAFSATASQNAIVSYSSSSNLVPGMIVALKKNSTDEVVPLQIQNISQMLGVVVNPNQAAVVLSPQTTSSHQVYVATSGKYNVLVSNQQGPIKTGTPISISSLAGIGMAASTSQPDIIGKALASFNGKTGVYGTAKLTDAFSTSNLSIGLIPVSVAVTKNPLLAGKTDYVPAAVGNAVIAISNKPESPLKIYVSFALMLVSFIFAGMLIYGGIRAGMVSIGRNPLSKKSIMRSLFQTVITGLMVFAAGLSGVYLILKL